MRTVSNNTAGQPLYSGWSEAFAIPDKSAETIVNIILDELIPRHSCPVTIVTDNGTEFKNSVMETLCQDLNIKHIFTSTYHPEGNGRTERFHRVMNDMLSKQASDRLERWELSLPQVLAAYRVGVSDSTQYAPFLYTRDPVLPIEIFYVLGGSIWVINIINYLWSVNMRPSSR